VPTESVEVKACLSHGRRLVPTLTAHFDPYTDYPLPGGAGSPNSNNQGSGMMREGGDWMNVLRKTLVATGDRRGSARQGYDGTLSGELMT